MGIIVSVSVIVLGGLIGSFIKKGISLKKFSIFGICVSLISIVGFIENIFQINDAVLKSQRLYTIVFSLLIGYFIGEVFKLEDRVSGGSSVNKKRSGAFEATMFFAIGGLQISGPLLLAVSGDSSLLYLKSAIDLPFAVMFGALYGKKVMLSAIPVAIIQVLILLIALAAGDFITAEMLAQVCAVGYVILFFSGFNMLVGENIKVKTVNMLPSIMLVILINLFY